MLIGKCPEIDHLKSNCNVINKFTEIVSTLREKKDFFWKTAPKDIGKLINKSGAKTATRSAFVSLIGFLTSTSIKFIVAVIYLGLFIGILWDCRNTLV